MKTRQKLFVPSKIQPLLEWREALKQITNIDRLFYQNGNLSESTVNDFSELATLIVMGREFDTAQLMELLALLNKQQIDVIQLHPPQAIESIITMRLALSDYPAQLKEKLEKFVKNHQFDFALQDKFPSWQEPGLVLMDMDSTTIQIECIDEIARLYGVGEQVSEVTALAMQGKLDFNESLRTRVSKLQDAPVAILKEVADTMPIMPGLIELLAGLKKAGWKVAIASGGFNYFADRLKVDYGFDYTIANSLEITDGLLTGNVTGDIVNAKVKEQTLSRLASQYNFPMSQTVAIGDGANDLLMLSASALGIAIHAKPIVQEKAAVAINYSDLYAVLCILSAGTQSWS